MTKFSIKVRFFYYYFKSKFLKKKIYKDQKKINEFKQLINDYGFTSFWFLNNFYVFDYFFPKKKNKKFKYLEVGTFEGLSLLYVLNEYKNVEATAIDLIDSVKKKIKKIKKFNIINSDSIVALRNLNIKKKKFDYIYIDGLHNGEHVIVDAIESFKLLEVGGIMIFDDFMLFDNKQKYQTAEGLCYFLNFLKKEIDILYFQNTLVIKKII